MSAELDELRREYEKFQAMRQQRAQENPMQRAQQLQQELAGMTASATSASGKVTVVAGPGGSIRDIQLTEEAMRQPAAALAAELKSTVQQAVAAAAREQAALVQGHMPGFNVVDKVMQDQATAFGTTVEELKESLAPPAAKPVRPPRNDDDFSEDTFMAKRQPPSGPPPSQPPSGGRPAGGGSAGDQFLKNLFPEEG